MMKNIAILGSTGSIGVSTLDICRQHPDRFRIVSLAAGRNTDKLVEQIKEFRPRLVSVLTEADYHRVRKQIASSTEVVLGETGAIQVASHSEVDTVLSAIVGAAGLKPTLAAIESGKTLALANKESMVIAGEIMAQKAREKNVKILPVDSEHSAIFQCLNGENLTDVERLILTASGGPFLHTRQEDFSKITKVQALKHPNWDMGAKITIDSATMMNKGLEVMEARWLFGLAVDKIDVVVHPQSIVHSMVEFMDGSVMAQMGEPDMRVPIAYALSYPRRMATGVKRLDLPQREKLTFFAPDLEKFVCLRLAIDVACRGKSYAPVINAANEVAVDLFLQEKIVFNDIARRVENCLEKHDAFALQSIDHVIEADRWARVFMKENIL